MPAPEAWEKRLLFGKVDAGELGIVDCDRGDVVDHVGELDRLGGRGSLGEAGSVSGLAHLAVQVRCRRRVGQLDHDPGQDRAEEQDQVVDLDLRVFEDVVQPGGLDGERVVADESCDVGEVLDVWLAGVSPAMAYGLVSCVGEDLCIHSLWIS
nr:hypothetical protein [Aureimonas frigidaquae]